jgi:two-component system chemotaxis sensor kinase CheA
VSSFDPDHNPDFSRQFLDDYYAECEDHFAQIRRNLLSIESQIGGGQVDVSLLDALFRSFHTIKGISGMVGLAAAEQLAHSIESILGSLRHAELSLSLERLDGLIEGVSLLELVIGSHRRAEPGPAIEALTEKLKTLSLTDTRDSSDASILVTAQAVSEETSVSGRTWSVEFAPTPALSDRGININTVRARLQEIGQILRSVPHVKAEGEIVFEFVVETRSAAFPELQMDGVSVKPLDEGPSARGTAALRPSLPAAPANVVRVDLSRLDELMLMIGEIVVSRARLEDQVQRARKSMPSPQWRGLWEATQTIGRQLRDLRQGVMRVRMVPVAEIFERMQFVVRDLARETGKKVVLDLVGRETEIDKLLIEKMMDPLLHLVRNAVSHGLERPDEREAEGKSPEGHLALRAITAGGNVFIEINDDGRGIDSQRVAERARDKGLLDGPQVLDNSAMLQLICLPGFSTRTEADRQSGRGVGMDVVRRTVDSLNGELSLMTEKGRGTTFTVKLPLTLAIAEALIVSVSGQTFAVPQTAIQEVIEVQSADVRALERNEIISYRDGALPLLRLAQLFNLPQESASSDGAFHVCVTGGGDGAIGVAVDRVIGHREIVVRGIADELAQVPGIAGATDLGDERVVLILDVAELRRSTLGRLN